MAGEEFYFVRNLNGVDCDFICYDKVNAIAKDQGMNIRYGPPIGADGKIRYDYLFDIRTPIVGIYMNNNSGDQKINLEDAINEVYKFRDMERKPKEEKFKTSAERICA